MEGKGRPHPGLGVEHKHLDRFSQVGWGKRLKMHLPRKNRTKKMSLLLVNLLVSIVDLERAEICDFVLFFYQLVTDSHGDVKC